MAFPTAIVASGGRRLLRNGSGPYLIGGVLYAVVIGPNFFGAEAEIWTSLDGGNTWTQQDSAGSPVINSTIGWSSACTDDANIYVSSADQTGTFAGIWMFNIATLLWDTGHLAPGTDGAFGEENAVQYRASDGQLVVATDGEYCLYNPATHTFGVSVIIGNPGDGQSWQLVNLVVGTGRMHFIFTSSDPVTGNHAIVYQQTLSDLDVLGAVHVVDNTATNTSSPGIPYYSASSDGTIVVIGFIPNLNPGASAVIYQGTSADPILFTQQTAAVPTNIENIAFDAAGQSLTYVFPTASYTFTHLMGTGIAGVLFVAVGSYSGTPTDTNVSSDLDGDFTLELTSPGGAPNGIDVWLLTNPSPGLHTITVTQSDPVGGQANSLSFFGVSPFIDNDNFSTGTPNPLTNSLTPNTSNAFVFDMMFAGLSTTLPACSPFQIEVAYFDSVNGFADANAYTGPVSVSVTNAWNAAQKSAGDVFISIAPLTPFITRVGVARGASASAFFLAIDDGTNTTYYYTLDNGGGFGLVAEMGQISDSVYLPSAPAHEGVLS